MISNDTDFEAKVSLEREATPIPEDPPFHILFLGDYSGRENQNKYEKNPTQDYKAIEIDRDNFDDVMRSLKVNLELDLGEKSHGRLELGFRELEDFHPDRIFENVSLFEQLKETRIRLNDINSFDSAAREVRSWFEKETNEPKVDEKPEAEEAESSGNLLDDILSGAKAESDSYPTESTSSPELSAFIKDIVKPHVIYTDEAEQEKLIAIVDEATSELMRRILHHKDFQALESAWRGLYFVVRRTETSRDLKLFLMDISKGELSDNLKQHNNLQESAAYRKIVVDEPVKNGGEPWALICGNYRYDLNVDDVAVLIRLAKISSQMKAPFLSEVSPGMLGVNSLNETPNSSDWNTSDDSNEGKLWTAMRTIPEAASLGLGLPRFITRLPYGESTEPTEKFNFEEFVADSEHGNYCWANPSFAAALLLAQSYRKNAWEMGNRILHEIEGLPTHLYSSNGEHKTKSCSEIEMTHEGCEILLEQGLMPLISFRRSDSAKFADFQSIAFPPKPLNGRWY